MALVIREEREEDYEAVEHVVKQAFLHTPMRSGTEHRIVERMRKEPTYNPKYSLVATEVKNVVGHVILSQAYVVNEEKKIPLVSLGPVSVVPEKQRQGIGTKLIEQVLEVAKNDEKKAVIVLGHPTYYPKFGFKPASLWGIKLPFDAPDDAFLALELIPEGLKHTSGIVEYSPAFYGD